jgi:hypothetical protein
MAARKHTTQCTRRAHRNACCRCTVRRCACRKRRTASAARLGWEETKSASRTEALGTRASSVCECASGVAHACSACQRLAPARRVRTWLVSGHACGKRRSSAPPNCQPALMTDESRCAQARGEARHRSGAQRAQCYVALRPLWLEQQHTVRRRGGRRKGFVLGRERPACAMRGCTRALSDCQTVSNHERAKL